MVLAQIVLFDGFDPLDAIAPYEILAAGGPRVEFVSAEGPRQVPSGVPPLSLAATGRLDPQRADLVVVPGAAGRMPDDSIAAAGRMPDDNTGATAGLLDDTAAGRMPDDSISATEGTPDGTDDNILAVLARTLDTPLPGLLKQALDRPGLTVATVCGGSLVLALAGLINGRPATTHRLGLVALAATGVEAVDARVVDDGDLVTASSVTSGLDLGLYLLEREVNPRAAHAVERLIGHERRGTVWRNAEPAR
jgi:putative intracellular protease/amidase